MTEDLTAVEGDPVEGGMGKVVDVVPAQFLREESAHASQSTQLRELCRVPKGIRKPESCASLTEATLVISLSVQELSDKRLTTGHISVVLDPATSNRHECAFLDLAFYAVKGGRIQGLQPFELLSLRGDEAVLGISLQEIALIQPRSCNLTLSLRPWPQPAGIDVTVSDCIDNGLLVTVVDLGRVDFVSNIFLCNLPASNDGIVCTTARNKGVNDVVADLQSLVFLPGVFWKLSRCV